MDNRRYLIYCDMMTELKLTNQLMNEYDSKGPPRRRSVAGLRG